jgi:hypothetical protein
MPNNPSPNNAKVNGSGTGGGGGGVSFNVLLFARKPCSNPLSSADIRLTQAFQTPIFEQTLSSGSRFDFTGVLVG